MAREMQIGAHGAGAGVAAGEMCIRDRAYPEQNRITLKKVFCFFEQMACAQEEVRELLMYAILEELGDEKEVLQRAQRFMGENTLELSNRVENFLGR